MEKKDDEGIRSFIALDLSPSTLLAMRALQDELRKKVEGVRWVKGDSIHLTLKFLGNVKEEALEELCRKLAPLCERHKPFDLSPGGVGAFPSIDRPRVVWLALTGATGELDRLWQDTEKGCLAAGFERDKRSFSPHLTLGRVKDFKKAAQSLARAADNLGELCFEPFRVVEAHLYRSELRPEGAVYTKIKSFPLMGEGKEEA